MINLKQEVLKRTEGWFERLRIKTGLASLPAQFLCRNLQEVAAERDRIPMSSTILLPRLTYFQNGDGDFRNGVPIFLQDESRQMDAVIRPSMRNFYTGNPLEEDTGEVCNGDTIYVPVLMNGTNWHYLNPRPDDRIFLTAFEIRRDRRSNYILSWEQRLREAIASKPALRTIPVRR